MARSRSACARAPTPPSGTSRPSSSAGGSSPRRTSTRPGRKPAPAARRRRPANLDRALALATDDLERGVLGPVDEVLHVLQIELDRHRQVLDASLELGGSDAVDELVERLAVGAFCLVITYPALDRFGDALGWQPCLEPLTVAHVAPFVRAADVRDVRGNRVLADLDRRTVEADVRDVVLAAAVRAAAHLDVDPPRRLLVDPHLNESFLVGPVEAHRARDPELARIGARA